MPEMFSRFGDETARTLGTYLPNIFGALAILIIGWIVARFAGAMVIAGLKRTELDNRLAKWLAGDASKKIEVEQMAGRIVFYVVMVFVLVGFLQALQLTVVSEPLKALLQEVLSYAPRVFGAVLLLVLAWLVATLLRRLTMALLKGAHLDKRLGAGAGLDDDRHVPISKSMSDAIYWLVLLLFLPAVLDALGLQGLLAPVQVLLNDILGFLPRLVAAGMILLAGWFMARLIQRIVTSLLSAAGLDRFAERLGIAGAFSTRTPSEILGLLVYILLMMPVIVAALDSLALDVVTVPAMQMLARMFDVIPNVLAAGLLLAITYVLARFAAQVLAGLLEGLGFDRLPERLGFPPYREGPTRPSHMVGTLVLAVLMLFAIAEAANILGFAAVGDIVQGLIYFAGQVILGLIILGVGLYLARIAFEAIRLGSASHSIVAAEAARVAIIALSGAMALRQMGLANEIIQLTFGLVLGAFAVAFAIAFGFGARDIAGRQVEKWMASLEEGRRAAEADGEEAASAAVSTDAPSSGANGRNEGEVTQEG